MSFYFVLAVLITLIYEVENKGTASRSYGGSGYLGAGYGGGYRYYRTGYYAPRTSYYLYPYSWRSSGGRATYVDKDFESKLEDVMCLRNVKVPLDGLNSTNFMFDSRRNCFHQETGQPGSPKNTPMDGIFIDVLRYNISIGQDGYLTVNLQYWKDEAQLFTSPPYYYYTVRFLKLTSASNIIDLANFFKDSSFSLPTSTVRQGARVTRTSIESNGVAFYFETSNDFFENAEQHEFYRPSALKVTIQLPSAYHLDFDIQTMPMKALQAYPTMSLYGTRYDPTLMDRIDLGQKPDEDVQQKGYVSWRRTINTLQPCISALSSCVNSTMLTPIQDRFTVSLTVPIANQVVNTTVPLSYLLNIGYYDGTETPKPDSAIGNQGSVILAIVAAVSTILFAFH